MTDWPTRISPSKEIAASALPGVLLVNIAGRSSWTEFEPVIRGTHDDPMLGSRYVILNRVAPTSVRDTPDDEFRRKAAGLLDEYKGRLVAFAYLIDADGFLGATARAVITGISAFSRAPFPTSTFKEAEPAARWVVSQISTPVTAADLVAALGRLVAATTPTSAA